MEKKITKKIIAGVIVFVLIFSSVLITKQSQAATSSIGNYYSNPNQAYGKNQYRFKVSDVVNSSTLTAVVGCTGVVNKVAEWMTTVLQSPFQTAKQRKAQIANAAKQIRNACAAIKSGIQTALGTAPLISDSTTGITTGLESQKFCEKVTIAGSDDLAVLKAEEEARATAARDLRTQCFDGIAISLAKNQLTSMTRNAMNWVNTGFGGNPFFVQNAQNLIGNISDNVLETGIETLLAPSNPSPYAQDFARAAVAQRGIVSSSAGLLGSLTSDLENFVTDPRSYYTDEQLDKASNSYIAEQTAYNAKMATESFANNFSLGGWNAWLALTQKEKNNPLGFNMLANQYISEMQTAKITETKEELAQNDGFMSQKVCDQWQMYDKDGKMINAAGEGSTMTLPTLVKTKPQFEKADGEHEYGECFHQKTITPGSLIKDKISNYLGSPERQLELVKTINDSLNALFSVLISKFEGNGLVGLSDSSVTTNWTDNINSLRSNTLTDSSDGYDNGGAYNDFNLTRDLGNTYIHETTTKIGTWDAQLNLTSTKNPKDGLAEKLYAEIAPIEYNGLDDQGNVKTTLRSNVYYEVTTPGKTKLVTDGYNSWQKGDRAFWDGEKWQNWKEGQQSPIKNRGVIQIQQDYVVAAKEVLKVLPGVMPALGKLDYCLPGPNPSYKANSSNAQQAFSTWINSTYVGPMDSSGERFGVKVDGEGESSFEDLKNTYPHSNIWRSVATEKLGLIKYNGETVNLDMPTIFSIFSNICNSKQDESLSRSVKLNVSVVDIGKYLVSPIWAIASIFKNSSADNCAGDYTYAKNGALSKTQANNIGFKTKIQEYLNEYVNNYMFNGFYDIFDKKMDALYFKNMTEPYIEHEDRTLDVTNDKNPAYVPMAQSGLDFIKDISTYGTNTADEQSEYQSSIATAKSNITRLEPIKAEVSAIIKAAQDRRYKELADLEKTTVDAIKAKYKSCFDEENVKFYDADNITGENEHRTKEESCKDGIDNDLDGLVDSKDEDCGAITGGTIITSPRERRPSTSDDQEE